MSMHKRPYSGMDFGTQARSVSFVDRGEAEINRRRMGLFVAGIRPGHVRTDFQEVLFFVLLIRSAGSSVSLVCLSLCPGGK